MVLSNLEMKYEIARLEKDDLSYDIVVGEGNDKYKVGSINFREKEDHVVVDDVQIENEFTGCGYLSDVIEYNFPNKKVKFKDVSPRFVSFLNSEFKQKMVDNFSNNIEIQF